MCNVRVATHAEDVCKATDLVLCSTPAKNFAVRIRNRGYTKYFNEFTIRTSSKQGPSELDKIVDGNADLMFYGFANGPDIVHWYILDLDFFRAGIKSLNIQTLQVLGVVLKHKNKDGSRFISISISAWDSIFGAGLVLQSGGTNGKKDR